MELRIDGPLQVHILADVQVSLSRDFSRSTLPQLTYDLGSYLSIGDLGLTSPDQRLQRLLKDPMNPQVKLVQGWVVEHLACFYYMILWTFPDEKPLVIWLNGACKQLRSVGVSMVIVAVADSWLPVVALQYWDSQLHGTELENAHNLAQENGVNDFLLLGNLEKAVKEIVDQPLPLVDGIEDQLVEFSEAMRCPTFAESSVNFEQKVGGSGSMKHLPIKLESGEKTQRCCGENGICSHWETPPQTGLILTKSNSTSVKILCAEMLRSC
ncbi:unnamed protein product [Lactuca saligna]|uniref:Uncharacterized protein n=1 Tax=Lactuca saligna TaxID=75948 RepID=A0AA35Z942_LACSI|nr:unnamed protein product [Lactuca saligna]